jgi:hypothetical protein
MILKLDLHVHTRCSQDAFTEPDMIAPIIRRRGLDGVALTEHDKCSSYRSEGILVVPGIEVSSRDGHIVAFGAYGAVPTGLSADQTIELLHDQNCVVVVPHPYDISSPSVDPLRLGSKVDGIETVNSSAIPFWLVKRRSEKAAKTLGVPMVAGSDSHIPSTIGDAYTLIDVSSPSVESILESIRSGRTTPCGSATSLGNRMLGLKMTLRKRI